MQLVYLHLAICNEVKIWHAGLTLQMQNFFLPVVQNLVAAMLLLTLQCCKDSPLRCGRPAALGMQ